MSNARAAIRRSTPRATRKFVTSSNTMPAIWEKLKSALRELAMAAYRETGEIPR